MEKPKHTRRKRTTTQPMPKVLQSAHVARVMQWPLGSVTTRRAAGENWTDCIVELVDTIRIGGRYQTRRVRYDGRFYIMHNGRRVDIDGALMFDVADVASHVYGVDAESDKIHNKTLKGY